MKFTVYGLIVEIGDVIVRTDAERKERGLIIECNYGLTMPIEKADLADVKAHLYKRVRVTVELDPGMADTPEPAEEAETAEDTE